MSKFRAAILTLTWPCMCPTAIFRREVMSAAVAYIDSIWTAPEEERPKCEPIILGAFMSWQDISICFPSICLIILILASKTRNREKKKSNLHETVFLCNWLYPSPWPTAIRASAPRTLSIMILPELHSILRSPTIYNRQ